jgi:enterochelin esterase family protein
MKKIGIAILLLSALCYAQSSEGFMPASTNVWGADYPRVDATGKVEFRVKAPNATKVEINFWGNPKLDMVKQPDGFWTVTTAPLVPGFHYYTVVVDGTDFNDPSSHTFFGGGKDASGIEVPEHGSTYYLPQDVPQGTVRDLWYFSSVTETGVTPSFTPRLVTTRRRRCGIPSSTCSTAQAKMRPAGYDRATQTSSSTTSLPQEAPSR